MFTIEEFLRISNQMRDYYAKKIKDSFQEFNFSPNEISILIVLKNNSTITTSTELKVVLGVSKTLISRSVDSLEKKGLICTCIDEKDSRIHHLQLTGECKPILKKLLFCKWVVIIRLFTMFRAHCIPISHFFWR